MFAEIMRYLLVGVVSNLVNFVIYYLFYRFGVPLLVASSVGYLSGLGISYTLGRLWIFDEKFTYSKRMFFSFLFVYAVGGIGMSLLTLFSIKVCGLDYRIGWIIGALFAVVNNFMGQKYFAFKKRDN